MKHENNAKLWNWIKIAATIFAAGIAWQALNGKIAMLEKQSVGITQNREDIIDMKADLRYIRQAVDEIKKEIKE